MSHSTAAGSLRVAGVFLFGFIAAPTYASFHIMEIEQVIGGVNGDTTAQAIQLRMRAGGQNQVQQARLYAWDTTGSNPVLLIDMTTSVPNGNAGDRVLIATANFANNTCTTLVPDFTMTNPIPAGYLAAGRITFEDDFNTVYWSLSFGGAGYTGSNSGSSLNDNDGNYGPPFAGPCPSGSLQALLFQNGIALSTSNSTDYALTSGPAVFTNNAGTTFTVTGTPPGVCGCDVPTDTDGDGTPDCIDGCPNDPNKIAPGACGCGVPETSCNQRSITQWRSVKTHSTCGELSIILDPAATGATSTKPTTETRGTTAANQGVLKVQVDFDGPVTGLNAANITVTYRPTIQSPAGVGSPVGVTPTTVSMADADTLSMTFASGLLPNLGCVTINIGAGTFTETITGDSDCNIRSLAGDINFANGSGLVTIADMLGTKAEVSAGTLATVKPKFDFNLSCGTITIADMLAVKAQVITPAKTALCP